MSSLVSKSNRKYPLPTEYDATFLEMRGLQFLWTQLSVDFGEGQSPVNCPIRARSARERATHIVSSGGRATSGTSSILLTNFGGSLMPDY